MTRIFASAVVKGLSTAAKQLIALTLKTFEDSTLEVDAANLIADPVAIQIDVSLPDHCSEYTETLTDTAYNPEFFTSLTG